MLWIKFAWSLLACSAPALAASSKTSLPDSAKIVESSSNCSCGYYDPTSQILFTDSIIVYFNETFALPAGVFIEESYENEYERGFNALYRQGADPENLRLRNTTADPLSFRALDFRLNPPKPDHVVVGSSLRTARRDIQYGSFRGLLRSPPKWPGGSALTMELEYNHTEAMSLNVQNTNDPSQAWISMLVHNEFPERFLGANYTTLAEDRSLSAWEYTEYRIDWTSEYITYYIGGETYRTISRTDDDKLPTAPAPFRIKHWSTGNFYSMQGPPSATSTANVAWMRLFFNSSTMTSEEHRTWDMRCQGQPVCATADTKLRGFSSYTGAARQPWMQAQMPRSDRTAAVVITVIFGTFSGLLLLNALLRKVPWESLTFEHYKHPEPAPRRRSMHPKYPIAIPEPGVMDALELPQPSPNDVREVRRATVVMSGPLVLPSTILEQDESNSTVTDTTSTYNNSSPFVSPRTDKFNLNAFAFDHNQGERPTVDQRRSSIVLVGPRGSRIETKEADSHSVLSMGDEAALCPWEGSSIRRNSVISNVSSQHAPDSFEIHARRRSSVLAVTADLKSELTGAERIDYLAGVISLSAMLITIISFTSTFSPALVMNNAEAHYPGESWARKTFNAYLINPAWFGPFLLVSSRFLAQHYLSSGSLLGTAEKVTGRAFRLLFPVAGFAMLEYFLLDAGATKWLEYLPSWTYSVWPYTVVPSNLGYFINELLELGYIIPNAAPSIIFNYCTRVLWTIPVLLQGSWLVLLGVVVIREIRTPWKRFGYYAFCIINHWYAVSWGTYFYFGVMLVDLEVTYNYRKWLYARTLVYYPLIASMALLALAGLSMDLATEWTGQGYAAYEYGIHPDARTGLPLSRTVTKPQPMYFMPKINHLVFSVALLVVVELSPLVQKFFSLKFFTMIHRHVFTIYLIHGLIFWSLGSWLCIVMATRGLPYWANILLVAIACYSLLFVAVVCLTPLVEILGRRMVRNIWQSAYEQPAPRRPTLFPHLTTFLDAKRAKSFSGSRRGSRMDAV
ncbi:MAG: hypothetical protein M1817_004961 [Caeruleum heppii]|nr:MAG: hypothetical protein M1817_004961 [Caeruleum heppii]